MSMSIRLHVPIVAALLLASAGAMARPGIYSCIDASGQRITSDRPILECNDRVQRELSSTGAVRRIIQPQPTAEERRALEEQKKREEMEQRRLREAAHHDRVLLTRYPNAAAHEAARERALEQGRTIEADAFERIAELDLERAELDEEMEFYADDPSRAPHELERAIKNNDDTRELLMGAIARAREESRRINTRFDEEAAYLEPLWRQRERAAPSGAEPEPDFR